MLGGFFVELNINNPRLNGDLLALPRPRADQGTGRAEARGLEGDVQLCGGGAAARRFALTWELISRPEAPPQADA